MHGIMRLGYAGILLLFLTACGAKRGIHCVDVQQFIGQQITFSESLTGRMMGLDTLLECLDTVRSPKLIVYYDSRNCNPCKMDELEVWRRYFQEADSLYPSVRYRIILAVNKNARRLDFEFRQHQFPYPVYYDLALDFEADNALTWEQEFHTFLLDRDNRVVLAGSPMGNPKMWELYKSTIARLGAGEGIVPEEKPER